MGEHEWGRLIYLVLLGCVLVGWFFMHNRQSLGKTVQQVMAWVFIFIGVIALVGLWDDVKSTVSPTIGTMNSDGDITIPRARDGHFYVTLQVNEEPVTFLVDTGASQVVLTQADARRVGIDPGDLNYIGRAMTANGEVRTAPVRLDEVALGPIIDRNVPAQVNEGLMSQSLLGMTYLHRFDKIEINRDGLLLTR